MVSMVSAGEQDLRRSAVERSHRRKQLAKAGAGPPSESSDVATDFSGSSFQSSTPLLTPVLAPIHEAPEGMDPSPFGLDSADSWDGGPSEASGNGGDSTRRNIRITNGQVSIVGPTRPILGSVNGRGPVVVLSGSDAMGDGLGAGGTVRRSRAISLTPASPQLKPHAQQLIAVESGSYGDGSDETTTEDSSKSSHPSTGSEATPVHGDDDDDGTEDDQRPAYDAPPPVHRAATFSMTSSDVVGDKQNACRQHRGR